MNELHPSLGNAIGHYTRGTVCPTPDSRRNGRVYLPIYISRVTTGRESDSMLRVSKSADPLPGDIEALQAMIVAAWAERDTAIAERDVAIVDVARAG